MYLAIFLLWVFLRFILELVGKAILSMTGGNPRIVNQAVDGVRAKAVKQMSHFDRRQQLSKGLDALKEKPQVKSLISH